jgi:hypothetical protein
MKFDRVNRQRRGWKLLSRQRESRGLGRLVLSRQRGRLAGGKPVSRPSFDVLT